MSSSELIHQTIAEHTVTVAKFEEACSDAIDEMGVEVVECLRRGGKICFFGNGGSAADAQHFAAEFVVRFVENRKGLPSMAFTTDTSIITACANDFGYEAIYARQIEALCDKNDIAVGISTSGNSGNVIRGLEFAKSLGIKTFAFTGQSGGKCGDIADCLLAVPSHITARVQECHLIAGHLICDIAEKAFVDQPSQSV
ncbi:MAG: phosphoheptose isomerase [Verrucomicrobiales bacterium]|jgi:D-sedoheptulose 7-phosphate isomerase|nr:phosphoheptose isomerase [Verrucomicrobiales bacterium]|tara:strand:- start:31838 stop:32431 length:594 start_codon:yes stop_codon:yes gene_type:complete